MFGIKAGINRSSISNLSTILVSEDYYSGYSFTDEPQIAPMATLFVNYKINDSRMAMEGGISYYRQASKLIYSDIKDFTYTCKYQYSYLGMGANLKARVAKGLSAGVGMRFGFNLQPENLFYNSNVHMIDWGTNNLPPSDSETQKELRDVIQGKNTTELVFLMCYEFENGLSIDLAYHAGMNDAVETLVNRHGFVDSRNTTSSIQLTAGWAIAVDQSKKDKRRRK